MARALSGIASGGVLKRPHVVFPDELPEDYRKAMYESFPGSGDKVVPLDPASWETITDAMAQVLAPGGTDPSAHLEGIDFAGKTGSAQTMSNALAARLGHAHSMKDNAWFVGFTPRRNPDLVVCILFEGGEHGRLAGRLAARVIAAYVNKQRRLANNLVAKAPSKVDVGAIWQNPDQPDIFGGKPVIEHKGDQAEMWGGHFYLDVPPAKPATIAAAIPSGN
jgi:penicillin-binding protein 2